MTDASDEAIGAVLEQQYPEGRRPLAFFSRKLSQTEKRYAALDKELLAIHRAIRHFHYLLEERPFLVKTDIYQSSMLSPNQRMRYHHV